ncbi:MAG: type III glutamate--ammonia ligase [Pseudomonadota bacterium]
MAQKLSDKAKDLGVKYFLISFTDLFGIQRSKLVPAAAIDDMAEAGAGFAGFATWLDMTPADPDMFCIPDPDSFIQLPWRPDVGWLAADPYMNDAPVPHAPRNVLKRAVAAAAESGYEMRSGVECEYMLISEDGAGVSDARDVQSKPCYDQQALMRRYDVVSEICDAMLSLGWNPYQNDHEDANGQFEMNWDYASALVTADRHAFFKFMVKSIAEKHGLRATFMPKPFANLTGNGCHMHFSLWSTETDENVFHDGAGPLGLSDTAYKFLGGVLHSSEAFVCITNPAVNSYKRINALPTASGATWAPQSITYTGNNRTHMVRIPDNDRFELRLADGATNPYLLQAAILNAGLDGLENGRDPGARSDVNMYTEQHLVKDLKKLPFNLLDALRAFEASSVMRARFGEEFVDAYMKLKSAEWNDYARHLTDWERDNTLDC